MSRFIYSTRVYIPMDSAALQVGTPEVPNWLSVRSPTEEDERPQLSHSKYFCWLVMMEVYKTSNMDYVGWVIDSIDYGLSLMDLLWFID